MKQVVDDDADDDGGARMADDDPQKLVHFACLNVRSTSDPSLLEWSEASLLQLINFSQLQGRRRAAASCRIDPPKLTYAKALKILDRAERSSQTVIRELRLYHNTSLREAIIANRAHKLNGTLPPPETDRMFATAPRIDYEALLRYWNVIDETTSLPGTSRLNIRVFQPR